MASTTLFTNKKAFGVEQESTPNTAETIEAADCFRAIEPSIEVVRNPLDHEGVRTTFGKRKPVIGGEMCNVSYGFHIKGSGAAGTAPTSAISDTWQAAGFSETDGDSHVDYDLSDSSSSITCQYFEGVAAASTGKSVVAKGVKGNITITLPPGGKCICRFEGQGGKSSDADATVLAASGEDTTLEQALISANMELGECHADSVFASDGDPEKIDDGAASNEELALSFTQSGNATVIGYLARLQKVGAPANETSGIRIRMETDNAGDPSGTPVSNTSVTKATSLIDDGQFQWYMFLLARGSRGILADSTAYHCVISADYDTDSSNCIQIDTDAVAAGGQKCKYYDAAWAALALKNICIIPITAPSGYDALKFGDCEISLNNEVSLTADDPNDGEGYSEADITNSDPTITVSPRDLLDSENDLAEYYDDQDELVFWMQVGSTPGNIVEIYGMRCVVAEDSNEDRDGKRVKNLTLRIDRELDGAGLTVRYR